MNAPVSPAAGLDSRLHEATRTLSPGYFAMVMATGIVSIGLHAEHADLLSRILLVLATAGFLALLVLNARRLLRHRDEFVWDFTHPSRSFGFYTFVAGGNVLGARIADTHYGSALVLLVVTSAFWVLRGYALPWTTRLADDERPIITAASGTWFMWAVGAQSIAVSAATLARLRPHELMSLIALAAWTIGAFLYLLCGVFVAMRLMAHAFDAADLIPPYWISMGAAAITAVAGTEVGHLPPGPYGDIARELVRGGALMAWLLASWLVPALIGLGWWRHATHRIPLRYTPDLWSIAFPVGMYAVASQTLSRDDHLPGLGTVGAIGVWVAVVVWLVISAMGVEHVVRDVLLGRRPARG